MFPATTRVVWSGPDLGPFSRNGEPDPCPRAHCGASPGGKGMGNGNPPLEGASRIASLRLDRSVVSPPAPPTQQAPVIPPFPPLKFPHHARHTPINITFWAHRLKVLPGGMPTLESGAARIDSAPPCLPLVVPGDAHCGKHTNNLVESHGSGVPFSAPRWLRCTTA